MEKITKLKFIICGMWTIMCLIVLIHNLEYYILGYGLAILMILAILSTRKICKDADEVVNK